VEGLAVEGLAVEGLAVEDLAVEDQCVESLVPMIVTVSMKGNALCVKKSSADLQENVKIELSHS